MRLKILILTAGLFTIIFHTTLSGQTITAGDTLFNQIDKLNRKQGYWKKLDDKGTLVYRGFFKDGKPQGAFIRYHENGTVKSKMNYLPDGHTVEVKFFYANEKPAAEGRYYDRQKDGEWKYYSFYEDFLSYTENYTRGKKNGLSIKYFSNGNIAEKLNWKNGYKNGEWLQFFPNYKPKLKAYYVNDKLEGSFTVYHLNGFKQIEGSYKNNLRDGEWHTYDLEGNLTATIHYRNGVGDNEEKITRQQMELLDSLERNKGKFSEPDLNGLDFRKR
ncbi:MAG: toxin-antitoxin system YwqK family antitoxin [Chlorobi bacterium]|nr:toxin-antitoxin system YwqK family antitoxin [Chlorobiota bacterium]